MFLLRLQLCASTPSVLISSNSAFKGRSLGRVMFVTLGLLAGELGSPEHPAIVFARGMATFHDDSFFGPAPLTNITSHNKNGNIPRDWFGRANAPSHR